MQRSSSLFALVLLLSGFFLAVQPAWCQVNDPALIAAAKKEQTGTLYTGGTPAAADRLSKVFEEKFGIHIDVFRANSGPLSARFQSEWQTNNNHADVVITSDELFAKTAGQDGWFAKIRDLPEAKIWPASAITDTAFAIDGVPYPMVWNTNAVPGGVNSWQELLDPKFKGRVMISDPRIVTTANGFFIMMRRNYGDDFLRKLGQQIGGVSPSANPGVQQVAAGADDVYVPGSYQTYLDLKEKGAPLGVKLVEPIAGSRFVAGMVTKAPHPNVAKLIIRYFMTVEGQSIYNDGSFSFLPNVPKTTALPDMFIVDGDDVVKERPELIRLLGLN